MFRLQRAKIKEYELNYQIVTHKEEPSSLIVIDNRFEQQRILIERNGKTFQPKTIATILEKNLGAQLSKSRVGIKIPLVYRKEIFWNVVKEYDKGIRQFVFDFPYPNMARPMEKLGASLKKFGVDVKGKLRLTVTAQRKDFLVIAPREENEELDEIVSYLSEVGKPIDIYLVSGRKVKCYSKENPIVVDVSELISEFRGLEENNQLFEDNMFEGVIELLNSLKNFNYPKHAGSPYLDKLT